MGFEDKFLPKNESGTKALDDAWYERFEEIASFQDYEYLDGEKNFREEQKKKFLAREIENPKLDYPALEKLEFPNKEACLLDLKKTILENEPNEIIKQVYRWRLNEKIAELRMLKASKEGRDNRFLKYSEFIYGKPEKDIYKYTISQIKNIIDKKLFDPDPETASAAKRLNIELFEALMDTDSNLNPKDFGLLKKSLDKNEQKYSSEEIKKSFEEALEKYDIAGWNISISESSSSAINVSQDKKEVFIPREKLLTKTKLAALIEHEIGTHVLRREKGETSKLKLLGLGLDRYLRGEEGLATYKEQSVEGASEFTGLEGHFAIALATGMDGKKRNFRKVFEILKDFYFIKSNKPGTEALESAKNTAWKRCVRTFRGTTSETAGACFTKDIVYREGNISIWTLAKNNSPELRRISVGKYDPSNPRHAWILDQLNITDETLAALDEEDRL